MAVARNLYLAFSLMVMTVLQSKLDTKFITEARHNLTYRFSSKLFSNLKNGGGVKLLRLY